MTSFTFGSARGAIANGSGTLQSTTTDITVTPVIDDGSIDVGDAVTLTGLGSSWSAYGYDSGETLFYLGSVPVGDSVGYVFSASSTPDTSIGYILLLDPGVDPNITDLLPFIRFSGGSSSLGNDPACFLEGTLVKTREGDVAVENLRPEDVLINACGHETKVLFVGQQTISTRLGIPERRRPVRFSAGCLGNGLPLRDLVVTGDHAILFNGMLVNANALVNGSTIVWDTLQDKKDAFRVFHVETEAHELIVAEGVFAETFVDYVDRICFDNFAAYKDIFGYQRRIAEMDLPRITCARLVPAGLRDRIRFLESAA